MKLTYRTYKNACTQVKTNVNHSRHMLYRYTTLLLLEKVFEIEVVIALKLFSTKIESLLLPKNLNNFLG